MTALVPLCVVMPAYNAEAYIEEALDSLFKQTRKDFEIIVVDDGSTDGTLEIVKRLASATRIEPSLRLLQQDREGPSGARNSAIAATSACLVGFLDADDRWAMDKVKKQLALMEAKPCADLSFTGYGFVDAEGTDLNEHAIPEASSLTYSRLLERNCIHTSTVIARRSALLREGGFDKILRTYEDFDLWLKIAAKGPEKIVALQELLVDYRRHGDQATGDWSAMHTGWQSVVAKQAKKYPDIWSSVRRVALGNQYEYCAALAYNAGDITSARSLISRCWRAGGVSMLWRREVLLVTAICIATFLPKLLHVILARIYNVVNRLRNKNSGHSQRQQPYVRYQDQDLD